MEVVKSNRGIEVDAFYKNILVLGEGSGGSAAVLKLSALFKRHYNIKIHLIDNNSSVKTRLQDSSIRRIISKKNIKYHSGVVTKIDLQNRKVFLDEEEIQFRFMIIDLESVNNFLLIKESGIKTEPDGRVIVDEFLNTKDLPFVYILGNDSHIVNPNERLFVSPVSHQVLTQSKLAAQNIFNEIYGYERKNYRTKIFGKHNSILLTSAFFADTDYK